MGVEESKVSDAVRTFLEAHGYMVFRMQSGRFRGNGGWITMNKVGTPDILAISKDTLEAVFVETKTKEGKASRDQIAFKEEYEKLGGICIIAHSLGDVIQRLEIV